jgi:hypothetical protein
MELYYLFTRIGAGSCKTNDKAPIKTHIACRMAKSPKMHLARLKGHRLSLAHQSSEDGINLIAATRKPHYPHSSLSSCAADRDDRRVEKYFSLVEKALARGHGPLLSLSAELLGKYLNPAVRSAANRPRADPLSILHHGVGEVSLIGVHLTENDA